MTRTNADVRKLLVELASKRLGFVGRLSSKNHVLIKHLTTGCTAAFSLSPSDRRSLRNQSKDIERLVSQVQEAGK